MTILSIVGARPQFIKAAVVQRALTDEGIKSEMIHTGQHFDAHMSEIFFEELEMPNPSMNLEISGGGHGKMTGAMLAALEREFKERNPSAVLVYGDTNSTLAGALAAAKLHLPVIHVEAGLRSFNRTMPEEINRVLTDHLSDMLFCSTLESVRNLQKEGITTGVFQVGDVMYDSALIFREKARRRSEILLSLDLEQGGYILATVHRAENTDSPTRLRGIVKALERLSELTPVILPLHPRTRKVLKSLNIFPKIQRGAVIDPVGFLDMIALEMGARVIVTDSGGVQKEAYFHRVPCVTLRDETEWVETVSAGWNALAGVDPDNIVTMVEQASPGVQIPEYGDGRASFKIAQKIKDSYHA